MANQSHAANMTQGSIWKLMVRFAIPIFLGNLFQLTYNAVDSIVIGKFAGENALAAVSAANPVMTIMILGVSGVSIGASVLMSRFYGAGDDAGMRRTYGLMTVGTQAASLLFMLAALLFPEGIVRLFSPDEQVVALGSSYLRIIAVSYPFLALTRGGGTLLRAQTEAPDGVQETVTESAPEE